jgi:hypothetical protein
LYEVLKQTNQGTVVEIRIVVTYKVGGRTGRDMKRVSGRR